MEDAVSRCVELMEEKNELEAFTMKFVAPKDDKHDR